MENYYECYNFFKECSAFVIKYQNFITACQRIRDHNLKLDPKMFNLYADLFADVQKEMESTCIEHKCIMNLDTDNESDISDIEESEDSDKNEMDNDDTDKMKV